MPYSDVMHSITSASLLVIFAAACAGSDSIGSAPTRESAVAPAPEAASPNQDAPEPAQATPVATTPESPPAQDEPTFMDRCVAAYGDTDEVIAQCHGLQINWLHTLSHDPFMKACVAAYGDTDLVIAQCQALWLSWWPM